MFIYVLIVLVVIFIVQRHVTFIILFLGFSLLFFSIFRFILGVICFRIVVMTFLCILGSFSTIGFSLLDVHLIILTILFFFSVIVTSLYVIPPSRNQFFVSLLVSDCPV